MRTTHQLHTAMTSSNMRKTRVIALVWMSVSPRGRWLSWDNAMPMTVESTSVSERKTTRNLPARDCMRGEILAGRMFFIQPDSCSSARAPALQASWQRESSVQHSEQIGAP